jgi:2-dehydropantoate 2-reductase
MGARLALAGNQVTFLARPRVVEAIQKHDLILIEDDRSQHIQPTSATSNLNAALQSAQPDLILLCVKAYDCAEAARLLKLSMNHPVPVLSLLNGINNEKTLSDELGVENIIPATLTTAVQMVEPGVIEVAKRRGVGIGGDHIMADELEDRFAAAGFRVAHYSNSNRMKWSKLLTNMVSNATSAITGLDPGQVFAHPGLARLEIDALREAVQVMRQLGFSPQNLPGVSVSLLGKALFLPASVIRQMLGRIVARGRGRKKPSLHFDIGRGKSEVDWLNGAVARYGDQLGVPTPINETLNGTMKSLVENASLHSLYLEKPDALLAKAYPVHV